MLGAALPIHFTSRIYLGQKLASSGVFDIPEAALQELADEAVRECQWVAGIKGRSWRTDITDWLDAMAYKVAYLLLDDRDAIGRQLIDGEERANLAALLIKHGVTVPRVDTPKGAHS